MAEGQESASGNNKKANPGLFLVLAIVNMLVVVGVGVMVYLGNQKREAQPNVDDVIRNENKEMVDNYANEPFVGELVPLETFLVNLAGSRGNKLAKINMEVEVEGDGVRDEIDKRKPQIRDTIIMILSSKSYAEVESNSGKDRLRDEIADTVNPFLTKGKIKGVYFTEFILN